VSESNFLSTSSPLVLALLLLAFGIPVVLGIRRRRRTGGEA
jgi:hypothetical protein